MNLFKKASPWVVASFMAASTAVAQSNSSPSTCPQKPKCAEEAKPLQLMAGYSAPARIEVRGCWDVYASGSFTYWHASQDNFELGYVVNQDQTANVLVNQDFDYKPGFKVALGMNFDWDNWDSVVEYSWFRGSDATAIAVTSPETFTNMSLGGPGLSSASQNWKLHMDLLNWEVARSYYVGTKLTFRPHLGLRGALIRQNLSQTFSRTAGNSTLDASTHSWAVGPRTGLNTNWSIGEGFRLFGNSGIDVLFTRYTKLDSHVTTPSASNLTTSQTDVNVLRTHMDLELGLGWGSYFDSNNWHVDISAGYGFQAFFDQNMFRPYNSVAAPINALADGDLHVHGLTATVRFDF